MISFQLSIVSFSEHFFIFFPSSSPGTPPLLFPSSPFLPLCHTLLFGFPSSHFSPSRLLLSSLLFLKPWRPLLFPLVCERCPSSLHPPDYSASLPSASSPPFISHSVLLILLFLPFTPLLLLAIIQFSPVFLSKCCHLALPQSSDWASLRIAYVRSPLYALSRSLILLAHVQEAKTLIFTPSGHLVLKKFVTKKNPH